MSARSLLYGSLVLLALVSGGCAWSNRANRPVWNAFETHLVPQDTTAFYAALPLTLPGGLLCILADSFVVHPAQIADDAWADAGELLDGIDWEKSYYYELAVTPFRAIGTPVFFVCMFLGRSLFDVPPHGAHDSKNEPDTEAEQQSARERVLLEGLDAIARASESEHVTLANPVPPDEWTAALGNAYEGALERGRALGRLQLYRYAQRHALPPWRADPARGLRDPDPIVRYLLLKDWPATVGVPAEVQAALHTDPIEAVRQLAHERWP